METLKKAKHKALYLLERMDRTEQELRTKLLKDFEPDVVEAAIEYVKGYHYIDDVRYVKNYILSKSQTKSMRQIEQELLLKKGVSKECLQEAREQVEVQDERLLIRKWIEKKNFDPATAQAKELQKFYLFLMRRGFRPEDIRKELSQSGGRMEEDF